MRLIRPPNWSQLFALCAGLTVLWLAAAAWLFPEIIRHVYEGRGPGFLRELLEGRDDIGLPEYLAEWRRIARRVTASLVGASAIAGVALFFARASKRGERTEGAARLSPPDLLLLGVAAGLLIGSAEAAYIGAKNLYLEQPVADFLHFSADSVWMAPVAAAVLGALLAALLAAISRVREAAASPPVALAVILSPLLFSLLMAPGRFHIAAAAVLALGIAVQAGRSRAGTAAVLRPVTRRALPVLAALPVFAALVVRAGPALAERRGLAELADTPAPDGPNVLLIVLDTERAANLSLYGYARPTTPTLERLARRGITFERAVAPASWTLPTHGTLFTGRHPHELRLSFVHPLADSFPTLAGALRAHGYVTGAFVANIFFCSDFYGFDRGFLRYEDQPVTPGMLLASTWVTRNAAEGLRSLTGNHQDLVRKTAADVNQGFLRWLSDQPRDRPYFAFLNYFDAHAPYLPPEPHNLRYAPSGRQPLYWLQHGVLSADYSDAELAELVDAYDSGIAYLDQELGRLIDDLSRRGRLDETLVVITSDHGEEFGEHGWMEHQHTVYWPSIHVPLLIVPPGGLEEGVRVEGAVALKDVPFTIAEAAGLRGSAFPSRSLLRDRVGAPPDTILSESGGYRSVVAGDLHYIRGQGGEEQLYDIAKDPWESIDLADSAEYEGLLPTLRTALRTLMGADPALTDRSGPRGP